MKKCLVLFAIALLSIQSFSQILFEPGYFINESDQKIECFIKNIDWENNPKEFEYRITQDAAIQKAVLETIKEFSIYNGNKYVRALVKMDRSSAILTELNYERMPVFQEELLFLKVLIGGKASLYTFRDNNIIRYFYKMQDSSEIVLLIHKIYLKNSNEVLHNNTFQQQIYANLVCENITRSYIENLHYERSELEKVFVKFNECADPNYVKNDLKKNKDFFNLTLQAGLRLNSLSISNSVSYVSDVNFGSSIGFSFGIEGEFMLPFNKRKWSILVEPTYQFFRSQKATESIEAIGELDSEVKYHNIEIPIGIRHYFYLGDKTAVFANVFFLMNQASNSDIEITRKTNGTLYKKLDNVKSNSNIALGAGFKYNSRFSIEFRYQSSRKIITNYHYWGSDYKSYSILLGYSLF